MVQLEIPSWQNKCMPVFSQKSNSCSTCFIQTRARTPFLPCSLHDIVMGPLKGSKYSTPIVYWSSNILTTTWRGYGYMYMLSVRGEAFLSMDCDVKINGTDLLNPSKIRHPSTNQAAATWKIALRCLIWRVRTLDIQRHVVLATQERIKHLIKRSFKKWWDNTTPTKWKNSADNMHKQSSKASKKK